MPQNQQEPKKFTSHAERVRLVWFFAMIHAAIVTPAIRVGQGVYAYHYAHLTFLVLLLYASYIPIVMYYIPAWIVLILYARFRANPTENSGFEGVQWPLGRYFHDRTARAIEVPILLGVGLAVRPFAADLGSMIASTAVSSAISLAMRMETIRAMKRQEADDRAAMAYHSRISKGGNW